MTPVKFGLVGYGFGGRYFHAPLLNAAPECELVGVMTSSPQRRDLVARISATTGALVEVKS